MPEQISDRILVVDDEPLICDLLYDSLRSKGYTVVTASNGQEALDILQRNIVAGVVTDVKMPKMNGVALLRRIRELFPSIPVVVITAYGTVSGAVEMIKQGATDYIPKPFSVASLHEVIERSICDSRGGGRLPREIITVDPQMLQILETVDTVANSKASVLIQGESGTGKELIARAIHERSNRRNKPFVAVNCAALPEALLESELFGHEQGSFTGAISRRTGKFELAHRGTLLLDEIVEMATSLQVKLLRVLQEGEIDRIGGDVPIKVDVRIIATTNRNIKEEIEKGRFRDDLFYRLYVVPLTVPPLRDRKGDISVLATHFLDKFSRQTGKRSLSISEEAMEALERYTWPGNVRELENVVERAAMLCRGNVLSTRDFFPHNPPVESIDALKGFVGMSLHDVEKHLIMSTLEEADDNKTRAAEILGITARTIRNKLQQYKAEECSEEER
jgi:two-component system response regulator AtoC